MKQINKQFTFTNGNVKKTQQPCDSTATKHEKNSIAAQDEITEHDEESGSGLEDHEDEHEQPQPQQQHQEQQSDFLLSAR